MPVRMTEAWLLIDESALRQASGNPNGKARLVMPPVERLESLPDPKGVLEDLLLEASGSRGRRRRRFDRDEAAYRLASLIEDFSLLLRLPAFSRFLDELARVLARWPSATPPSRKR